MATTLLRQMLISSDDNTDNDLTVYLNDKGNVFMHQNDGTNIDDFWAEINWNDWQELVSFINELKQTNNV